MAERPHLLVVGAEASLDDFERLIEELRPSGDVVGVGVTRADSLPGAFEELGLEIEVLRDAPVVGDAAELREAMRIHPAQSTGPTEAREEELDADRSGNARSDKRNAGRAKAHGRC